MIATLMICYLFIVRTYGLHCYYSKLGVAICYMYQRTDLKDLVSPVNW